MTSEGLITAPEGITLEEAKSILAKARKEKLPIVDKDFNLKGLITIKDIEKQIKYPLSAKDDHGRLLCGAGSWYHRKHDGTYRCSCKRACRCHRCGLRTRTFFKYLKRSKKDQSCLS